MPILCATDFSETADRASLLAAALAQKLGDRLVLLHVTEPVTVALPYPVDPTGAIEVSIREAGETAIASAVDKLGGQGIDVTGRVAYGTAEASILDLAKELRAQLIVVGTHGRKGVARLFLGSVAAALAKSAPCPVVVCGAHPFDLAAWQAAAPVRLTLGFDATRASRAAMAWTGALPAALARTVTVVRPYWPAQEASRYGFDQLEASANAPADLVRLLERDLAQEIPASVEIEAGGTHFRQAHVNAAEILAETAVSLRANAIVIGVSGHGLERWDALDHRALLRNATVPVFCVPESVRVQEPEEEIPTYRSALIATDLSPESNRALAKGYGLLSPAGGRVELCHVHERRQMGTGTFDLPLGPRLSDEERGEIERRLRALIPRRADSVGIKTNVSVLESHGAAESILQAAKRLGVDVIVMASHGRSGLKRAVLGSVAEQVVRHASTPVLVVHEPTP